MRDLIAIAITAALLATLFGDKGERKDAWQSLAFIGLGLLVVSGVVWSSQ